MNKFTALFLGAVMNLSLYAQEDVVWTSLVGMSVTGTTITKTGSSGWNSDAVSQQRIHEDQNGYVLYTVSSGNQSQLIGLNEENNSQSYSDSDFSIYFQYNPSSPSRVIQIRAASAVIGTFGAYNLGDKYKIERIADTIYFKRLPNGSGTWATLYAHHAALPAATANYPELMVDICINQNGGSATGVQISQTHIGYLLLSTDYPAAYAKIYDETLRFTWISEEYSTSNWSYVIRDELQASVGSGSVAGGYGTNKQSLSISGLSLTQDKFYQLELTNPVTGEVQYLRFKLL